MCPAPTCDNHASYMYLVEKHILEILKKWATGYELKDNDKIVVPKTSDFTFELAAVKKSKEGIMSQLDKAFEAFETGLYDADTFKLRSTLLKNKLTEIETKITELQNNIDKAQENEKIVTEFIPKVKKFVDAYESLNDAQIKNNMFREIIDHIDYFKGIRGHGHEEEFDITVYPRLPKV